MFMLNMCHGPIDERGLVPPGVHDQNGRGRCNGRVSNHPVSAKIPYKMAVCLAYMYLDWSTSATSMYVLCIGGATNHTSLSSITLPHFEVALLLFDGTGPLNSHGTCHPNEYHR